MNGMTRRALAPVLLAAGLLAAGATACSSESAGASAGDVAVAGTAVEVRDNDYTPSKLQVQTGQVVTWTWTGRNPHDVSFGDIASAVQKSGTFTRTFDEAGEFSYKCRVHPGMRGTIVVVPV